MEALAALSSWGSFCEWSLLEIHLLSPLMGLTLASVPGRPGGQSFLPVAALTTSGTGNVPCT